MTLAGGLLGLAGAATAHSMVAWRLAPPWRRPWGLCRIFGAMVLTVWLALGAPTTVVAALSVQWHHVLLAACCSSALACAWVTLRLRALCLTELVWAVVLLFDTLLAWAAVGHALTDIASPAVRGLALWPVPALLCGVFTSACVLMLPEPPRGGAGPGAGRRVRPGDAFEFKVARRLLMSRLSGVLSLVTGISIVGVALGVWLVIVAMGILSGFEQDLTRKIIGANAHLVLSHVRGEPLHDAPALRATLLKDPEVQAAAQVVEAEVAVAGSSQYAAATLFGIDANEATPVLDVLQHMVTGDTGALSERCAPLCPVVVGIELARALQVSVGDRIRLISAVHETLTPVGPAPKSIGLVVTGVFASKMYDYDSRYIFMGLDAARRFTQMPEASSTGIALRVKDPDAMAQVTERVHAAAVRAQPASQALQALSWTARNQTLFSALALERVVAGIVLAFIILVASFSIVNTLTMSILERRHEIAMLRTMGAQSGHILRIFVAQGVLIGTLGLAVGTACGVGTLAVLEHVPLGIPYEVYYLEAMPVRIAAGDIAGVALFAWLIVFNFAVFPSLRGAALRPVEGLRDS